MGYDQPRNPLIEATAAATAATSAAFSPDQHVLLIGGDATGVIWALDLTQPANGRAATKSSALTGHTAAVQAVVPSARGGFLASGSDDGTIRLWTDW